ncbi:MAG: hypothetical protein ACLTCI_06085 [[Clostridium] nexile]
MENLTIMYDDPKFIQEYFDQITEEAGKPVLSLTYKNLENILHLTEQEA